MPACPVCDTPVAPQVSECPTCGKVLRAQAPLPDLAAGGLEGLDLSRAAPVGAVVLDAPPGVEHSSLRTVGEVALDRTPDLVRTGIEGIGEVAIEVPPDVERTSIAQKEWTPESDQTLCTECNTPATGDEVYCLACAHKLPPRRKLEAMLFVEDAAPGSAPAESTDPVKCPRCGCFNLPSARLCGGCSELLAR
jgi:hypothetical protein